ncbi:MAG: AAA family ATPase, partial [Solobacterium sp.]|nr:AAA family ATPase [Solobacterium sp.]
MTEKPILYMPIGLPASGKSTFLKKLKNTVILSGDTLRGELFGDERLQYTNA